MAQRMDRGNHQYARRAAILISFWLAASFAAPTNAEEDSLELWEEHSRTVESRRTIGAMGPDLFGDSVNFYTGTLSFSNTDTSIAGNNSLPVAITRTFVVRDNQIGRNHRNERSFADWDIDLPYVGGVFATSTGWVTSSSTAPLQRCSVSNVTEAAPPIIPTGGVTTFEPHEYWHGHQINIPGRGSQELLLTTNGSTPEPSTFSGQWKRVTNDWTYVRCIAAINGGGEGFIAVTPDGTTYRFDHMASRNETQLKKVIPDTGSPGAVYLPRQHIQIFATRVEDRFGNWVEYTYDNLPNERVRLTQIAGYDAATGQSDGRAITLTYNAQGNVSKVTENGREWLYEYDYSIPNEATLTKVTQPDSSEWTIDFRELSKPGINYHVQIPNEPWRTCLEPGAVDPDVFTGTITHPSGATGEFRVEPRILGRSNVPEICYNVTAPANDETDDVSAYPVKYYSLVITRKRLTGPGLSAAEWDFDYDGNFGFAPTVAGFSRTTVDGPDGQVKYTFGNSFGTDEGLLLSVRRGSESPPHPSVESTSYQIDAGSVPFPGPIGTSPRADRFPAEQLRPAKSRTITRDDGTFVWTANTFDQFGRPVQTNRTGYPTSMSRTDTTQYHDHMGMWVLGQVSQVVNQETGKVTLHRTYDSSSVLPLSESRFGALRHELTWNSNGTLATVKDAIHPPTTLSNWKRGIPQSITYPDATTASAVVNGRGEITSITDPLGNQHGYSYDSMSRLSEVTYPSGPEDSWFPTTISFTQSGSSSNGLPSGHWKQEVSTGNARQVTRFDALWRPVVTTEYDATGVSETQRAIVRRYDIQGRETFASYAVQSAPFWFDSGMKGIHNTYDDLGRLIQTSQDSELGPLQTTIEYLPGFARRVTDPKFNTTTTSFQAFGAPDDSAPILIQSPEAQSTSIVRDVFGKPLTITRSGTFSGGAVSAMRAFVYDANERLCKRIDPESGATLIEYDGAGNVQHTATGSTDMSNACSASPTPEWTTFNYDQRDRVIGVTYPGTTESVCYAYYPDGSLSSIGTRTPPAGNCENSVWYYSYNKRRLLTAETFNHLGGLYAFNLDYDGHGHLVAHSYPSGRTVSYAPNALGQPTAAAPFATGAKYFPDGSLKQFTFGNGKVRVVEQNERRLPSRVTDAPGGSAIHDWAYTYDGVGNVASITDHDQAGLQNRTLQYDGLNRLVQANAPNLWGTASYEYDPLDNLRSADVGARSYDYNYDTSWRLSAMNGSGGAPSWTFGYDVRGNQTSRAGGSAQTRTFDAANRLTAVSGVASYRYDGHGRRTMNIAQGGSEQINLYTLDGKLRQQRVDATDAAHSYMYLGNVLVARVGHSLTPAPPQYAPIITSPSENYTGSYLVSWGVVPWATYELEEQVDGGGWVQIHAGGGNNKSRSGQAAGSTYDYRVRGCNFHGCGPWSTPPASTDVIPAPSVAPDLTAPTHVNSAYTVSWTPVEEATQYELETCNAGNCTTQTLVVTEKSMSGSIEGSYAYRARGVNPAGPGPWSAQKITIVSFAPPTPTLSAPATNTTGTYTLTWSLGGTQNHLEISTNGSNWGAYPLDSPDMPSQQVTVTSSGTKYHRVKTCNTSGCSGWSNVTQTVVTLPPATPTGLSAPATNTTGSYTVSWSSASGATSYILEEKLNSGSWTTIHNASATSKARSGLGTGTWYYRVRACNSGGCSSYSGTDSTQVTLPPPTPGGLSSPSSNSTGSYTVSWSSASGATSYTLQEKLNSGSWSTIYNAVATSAWRNGRTTGTWYYRVRACNSGGCSGFSGTVATQVTLPPTSAPWLSVPSSSSNGQYTVSWGTVSGATGYQLQERYSTSGSWNTVYSGAGTSLARSKSVSPYGSSTWYYRVRATNAGGSGPFSATKSVFIPQASGGGGCGPLGCEDPNAQPPEKPPEW